MAQMETGIDTVPNLSLTALHSRSPIISRSTERTRNEFDEGKGQNAGDADIGSLIEILRRNLGKILAATIISMLAALTYLAVAKPTYTTTASLFIDPRSQKVMSDQVVDGAYGTDLALVESQASLITSDSVLSRVVDTLHLADDPDYAPRPRNGLFAGIKTLFIPRPAAPDPGTLALNTLANSVKVKRAQKSYVVDLEVSASSPAKAARVADAVLAAYLADQTTAKSENAKRANSLIDARLGELREQVRAAETRYDDYKRANKLLTSEGGVVTEQQLTKLNGELATARAVTAETKARYDQIQETLKSPAGASDLPDAIRSGLIQKLREQYAQVARREAALASQLQDKHPVLIDVRSQLAEVQKQINAELKRIASSTGSEYEVALNRERDLTAQLESAKEDVTHLNTAQIKARELEQEVATSRELMGVFLQRAKETQEQQNISTPDARIVSPPSIPTRPSKPVPMLILGLGLLGGLGLGLAWALVSDHLDDSVHSAAELAKNTGLPNISSVPTLRSSRIRGITGALLNSTSRMSAGAFQSAQFSDLLRAIANTSGRVDAAYRQSILRLLTKIKSRQRPGLPHTVMMVSPLSGVGTSATALAVAYAAALRGDRVLLVDATSSKPDLSLTFATTLKPTTVVVDSKEHLDRITAHDERTGVAVLPIALADLRTLKQQQRRKLVGGLNSLIQNYDLVLIDGGAILEDEASTSLLPIVDQVMIVGRANVTTRDDIANTLEILEPVQARITAGILTVRSGTAV